MNNTQTSGWTIEGGRHILDDNGYVVADVQSGVPIGLLAAAPELLEACKAALIELHCAQCRDNVDHTICLKCGAAIMVRAAIAKAEGGQ